jgi:hypothetical protein
MATEAAKRNEEQRREERNRGTTPQSRITTTAEFDARILKAEDDYGVQLDCRIDRNSRANGDGRGWLGEVWYYEGVTKISTSAASVTFHDTLSGMIGNLTLMLRDRRERRELKRERVA